MRENPPSGGVSVLSESIPVSAELEDYSLRILDHVRWHGVAMVEFKVTSEGRPYLMEVNARFWGSLQLAIDAGIDFPWLLYKMAIGKKFELPQSCLIGAKNRWLLGDMDHLYYRLMKKEYQVASLYEGVGTIKNFLNFFDKKTRNEVMMRDDMGPFYFELRQALSEVNERLLHKGHMYSAGK